MLSLCTQFDVVNMQYIAPSINLFMGDLFAFTLNLKLVCYFAEICYFLLPPTHSMSFIYIA
jgi:hypothetical protein